MKNYKTIVTAAILIVVAATATVYTGCVTDNATGKKQIDPVAFSVLKGGIQALAYEYVVSEDADEYVEDFEKVVGAINIFLNKEATSAEVLAFVKELEVEELDSGYARIAVSVLSDLYLQSYQAKVNDKISEYVKAKELLVAVKEGFEAGLKDRN